MLDYKPHRPNHRVYNNMAYFATGSSECDTKAIDLVAKQDKIVNPKSQWHVHSHLIVDDDELSIATLQSKKVM